MSQSTKISRAVILLSGIFYTFIGISLILFPKWFFTNIGNFPPFNRYYMGDVGSFILPLGIGLMIASRDPLRHLGLIGAVSAANLLHGVNHIYDAIIGHESVSHWLSDSAPLVIFAGVFLWAVWQLNKSERIQ